MALVHYINDENSRTRKKKKTALQLLVSSQGWDKFTHPTWINQVRSVPGNICGQTDDILFVHGIVSQMTWEGQSLGGVKHVGGGEWSAARCLFAPGQRVNAPERAEAPVTVVCQDKIR